MILQQMETLKNSVREADYILVGLGEEWNVSYEEMIASLTEKEPVLAAAIKIILENEQYADVLPYMERLFYKSYIPDDWKKAYEHLFELLKEKNYYIVSLTLDSYLTQNGFDSKKMVNPCGNYNYLQCSYCGSDLVDSGKALEGIDKFVTEKLASIDYSSQEDMDGFILALQEKINQISCQVCSNALEFNNITAKKYNESGYLDNWQAYMKWLTMTVNKKLCIIEAGAGMKFPSVIRWPFEKTALYNQKATMYRIHHNFYQINQEVADRSYGCKMNSVTLFATGEVKVDE